MVLLAGTDYPLQKLGEEGGAPAMGSVAILGGYSERQWRPPQMELLTRC